MERYFKSVNQEDENDVFSISKDKTYIENWSNAIGFRTIKLKVVEITKKEFDNLHRLIIEETKRMFT